MSDLALSQATANARRLIAECDRQIERAPDGAAVVLIQSGRMSTRRRRFGGLPGAPLGLPVCEMTHATVAVRYDARELRAYLVAQLAEITGDDTP